MTWDYMLDQPDSDYTEVDDRDPWCDEEPAELDDVEDCGGEA